MIIGALTVELQVPASQSLKDKRSVRESLISKLRREFNIAIAEIDNQDSWQLLTLAVVGVSNDKAYLQGLLDRVLDAIEESRRDVMLLDYEMEII